MLVITIKIDELTGTLHSVAQQCARVLIKLRCKDLEGVNSIPLLGMFFGGSQNLLCPDSVSGGKLCKSVKAFNLKYFSNFRRANATHSVHVSHLSRNTFNAASWPAERFEAPAEMKRKVHLQQLLFLPEKESSCETIICLTVDIIWFRIIYSYLTQLQPVHSLIVPVGPHCS